MRLKIENVEQANFYKMPKKIYEYDLKPIDRELYMLCLENWRLSIQNNWVNEEGEIYFYAAQETLAEKMKLDKKAVIRAFKKLVELGILQVEKEKGMLNKYFLTDLNMDIQSQKGTSTSPEKVLHQSQKGTSTSPEKVLPPVPKRDTIKNKYNKNEIKRINKKEYIVEEWNKLCDETGLSKIRKLSEQRKRKLEMLLKKFTIEEILEALYKINESEFLQGKNDRNWKMDFDDFLEERKFIRLLEGKYGDKNGKNNIGIKTDKTGKKQIDLTEEDIKNTLQGWGL